MAQKPFISVDYDGEKSESEENNFSFQETIILEQTKENEKRKDWMHLITHGLAAIIILNFILILDYQILTKPIEELNIPTYLISIVSTVIGFYFAHSLWFDKEQIPSS